LGFATGNCILPATTTTHKATLAPAQTHYSLPAQALFDLGFGTGSGRPTLTAMEVDMLANSCDVDGNGFIDSVEW
jgi:hypothetical protein